MALLVKGGREKGREGERREVLLEWIRGGKRGKERERRGWRNWCNL